MKKWSTFVIYVCLVVFAALGPQTAKAETKLSGNLNFGFYSAYVGGLSGSLAFDDPVFQQSATLNMETPIVDVSGTFWSSVSPRGGFNSDFGDEIDYMLNISKLLGKWRIGVGYSFCDLYRLGEIKGDLHTLCFNVLSPPIKGVSFYGVIEKEWSTDEKILDGGVLWKVGANYTLALPFDKQKLSLDLCFGGNDGAYGTEPKTLNFGRLAVSLPTTLPFLKATLSPIISFQKSFGDEDNVSRDKVWGGVSISIPF